MVTNRFSHKCTFIFFYALFLSLTLFAEEVTVTSEISGRAYENEPFKVNITITHDEKQTVDMTGFYFGKDKVTVELEKEVKISPSFPLLLSIYSFTMRAQPAGLYALPAISVRVADKTYQSIMTSYSVEIGKKDVAPAPSAQTQPAAAPSVPVTTPKKTQSAPASSPPPATAQEPASAGQTQGPAASPGPKLKLEAVVDGSNAIYPGQRTKLVYKYFFSGDIALTKEVLPLLDAEGFIKIGEKEITDSVEGGVSIRRVSQQVEAVKPGTFSFGPSQIEGRSYTENVPGSPVFTSDKISSEAAPVVITVKPFPIEDKPASFNGAVGQFTFKTSLLSPPEMAVGDEISLLLEISGNGNLKNITLPDLCCQPGVSGFFRLSDIPPSEEIEGETKKIVAKFRPLNAQIKAVPTLEFSFFDPETATYTSLKSKPIPITVKAGNRPLEEPRSALSKSSREPEKKDESALKLQLKPAPIEIESLMPLTTSDLHDKLFGSWWSLMIIPFGIALLIYQDHLKSYLTWKAGYVPVVTSKELYQNAFVNEKNGEVHFEKLKKAFKMAIADERIVPSADIPDKDLPDEGIGKEVKVFLSLLDEKSFAGNGAYNAEEIHRLSDELMARISLISGKKDQGLHL
ncbi:MAG TPA: hypothetical protein VGP47_03255 [Parachlamydiaceae bacterium]|nr:hypothetical protein [Parachlamydiaceae bacterium]